MKYILLNICTFLLMNCSAHAIPDPYPTNIHPDSADNSPKRLKVSDPYLRIRASATDPLYTTYAASIERSKLYGDKSYKMIYYEPNEPLYYSSDQAGRIFTFWMVNSLAIDKISRFYQKPQVLHESLSMMAYVYLDPLSAQESRIPVSI